VEVLFLASEQDPGGDRITGALEDAGHRVRRATRAAEAEHLLDAGADVLLADGDLIDADAFARIVRSRPGQAMVAWLPRASTERVADLLELGFIDVLDAAMGTRELAARMAAIARRADAASATIDLGPLTIDGGAGESRWGDERLRLTRREREVLQVLAESPGRTVRRERVYRQVWGYAMARGDRSVDVNIRRLRAKLAAATGERLEIVTEPGVGYRLELRLEDAEETPDAAIVTRL
jgi:DNA-binding response OmpR family regulator